MFSEILYILMNGTGVGFSPSSASSSTSSGHPRAFIPIEEVIQVADSKLGWAEAYDRLLKALYQARFPSTTSPRCGPRAPCSRPSVAGPPAPSR